MESWLPFINAHAPTAHWYIFGMTLLAGLNVPFSIDLLMIVSATLAAAFIPSHLFHLFFAIFLGCIFSAWISYWFGRLIGPNLMKWPFFSKFLTVKKVAQMKQFYEKRGLLTLMVGRFIPFGVRNCLFMTTGMSQIPFLHFALRDALACTVWCITCFSIYYTLGKNFDLLYNSVKTVNLIIFIAFSVTVIGIIWYKKRKKDKETETDV